MLEDTFSDNMRQSKVVMKYEFRKYLEGKKIALYAVLMGVILLLVTALPYTMGDTLGDDPDVLASSYASMVQLLVLLSATLFASGVIVSEYEERTGLLLFTKPLRKWSIYLGKAAAAGILGMLFITVYYAIVAVISLAATGGIASNFLISFGMSILYVLATTGVAVMLSSMVKRSSTAAILTFVLLFMIMTIVTSVMTLNSVDAWFMLDDAAGAITGCISDPGNGWADSAAAMVIWGTLTGIVGYLIFRRREF